MAVGMIRSDVTLTMNLAHRLLGSSIRNGPAELTIEDADPSQSASPLRCSPVSGMSMGPELSPAMRREKPLPGLPAKTLRSLWSISGFAIGTVWYNSFNEVVTASWFVFA